LRKDALAARLPHLQRYLLPRSRKHQGVVSRTARQQ
jgi:hypothetical protein